MTRPSRTLTPIAGGDPLQASALELVGYLCALEQAGRLYDINNSAVRKLLEQIHGTVQSFVRSAGEDLILTLFGYSAFINRRLLRPTFSEYQRVRQLHALWERFGIGEMMFPRALTLEGTAEFAALLFGAAAQPHLRPALFTRTPGGIRMRPVVGDERPGQRQDPHAFTIRAYCLLLALAQRIQECLREGKPLPLVRIKRTLQVLADLLDGQEHLLAALTRVRTFRGDLAGHLAGTAVLALAVGRRLELGRIELMSLSLAALFHDLPKLGLKDEVLNSLEQPETIPAADRARVETHWLKPVKLFLEGGGLTDEGLSRLVVMSESQLEFTRRDLYAAQGLGALSLLSRIVAVCDAFDTLAWVRPQKPARTAHYAMMTVLQSAGAGGSLDAAVAHALLEAVGLYPTGSPVLLNTGEIGVVTDAGRGPTEKPRVRLVFDARGAPVDGPEIDLAQDAARQVLWPLTVDPLGVNPVACLRRSAVI